MRAAGKVTDSNETGWYDLQSRYYDPEVGRFLNADVFVSTGQGLRGTNMFIYCGNDPVNRADPAGTMDTALPVWRFVLPKVGLSFGPIGAVVVGGVTLITAILTALGTLTDYPDYALPMPAPAPAIPTPRSKEATEEKVITADPPPLSTVIYRHGGTLADWHNAGASSVWTTAVKSVVIKWVGGN